MRFFKTGINGGYFDEFVQGNWDGKTYWNPDSLYLCSDIFDDLGLYANLFSRAIQNYSHWGVTVVTRTDWKKITHVAAEQGGEIAELIKELSPWAEDNFQNYEVFIILGI